VFNVWFAKSLQDRLKASKSGVVVNSLHPGFVLTSAIEKIPDDIKEDFRELAEEKAYTMEEGGRFLLQAALQSAEDSEKEKVLKGAFFTVGQVSELSEWAKGDVGQRVQEKLWVRDSHFFHSLYE